MAVRYHDVVNFIPEHDEVLKRGARGADVVKLQELLSAQGLVLKVDGVFGPATEQAVRDWQYKVGLVQDGIAGPKTLTSLLRWDDLDQLLKQSDLEAAARKLGVELPAVMAVNEVESRGSGFHADGRPVILFERHQMRRQLVSHGIDPKPWMASHPHLVSTETGGYSGGTREHQRLHEASQIHRASALESASWGAFQIMGYHWKALGYASLEQFIERMHRSEADHLEAFVRFVQADRRLIQALKTLDFARFAEIYNGPGYKKHKPPYDERLETAYRKHRQALGLV